MKTLRKPFKLGLTTVIFTAAIITGISSYAKAAVLSISNSTDKVMTYDVSGMIDDQDMQKFVHSIMLKSNNGITYGGPTGLDTGELKTKDKMVKNTKVFKDGIQIASLIPVLADPTESCAFLLAAADGTSDVFSFFDFGTENAEQLVANVDFDFIGFETGTRIPILITVATGERITDSNGQLLPQFQFTGLTTQVGKITDIPILVPEPTSTLGLLAFGTLGVASTLKRKLKPSKPTEKETQSHLG
jgi:hypothetical protein